MNKLYLSDILSFTTAAPTYDLGTTDSSIKMGTTEGLPMAMFTTEGSPIEVTSESYFDLGDLGTTESILKFLNTTSQPIPVFETTPETILATTEEYPMIQTTQDFPAALFTTMASYLETSEAPIQTTEVFRYLEAMFTTQASGFEYRLIKNILLFSCTV